MGKKKDRKKGKTTLDMITIGDVSLGELIPSEPLPSIGSIVLYRTDGRNGLIYDLPAMVTCTEVTHPGDYPDGSRNPLPVPSDPFNVHLTVFTPGGFGTAIQRGNEDSPWIVPTQSHEFKQSIGLVPGSGTYVEWDVPINTNDDPTPRSWRWANRSM